MRSAARGSGRRGRRRPSAAGFPGSLAAPVVVGSALLLSSLLPRPADGQDPTIDEQIQDLDEAIEALEATREARTSLAELRKRIDEGSVDLETVQEITQDLRSGVRLTDKSQTWLENTYGIDGAGIAYELRQLFSLAGALEGVTEGGLIERYGSYAGNTYSVLSAADGLLESIRLLRDGETMSAGEQLRSLANWLDAVEDGLSLLLGSLNPVISAMLNVYTGALETTAVVVEEVIEPRNEKIRESMQMAEEALGSGPETGSGPDPVVESLDRAIANLEAQRDELEARKEAARERTENTDIRNAYRRCRDELGTDAETVESTESALREARKQVHEMTERREELRDEVAELSRSLSSDRDQIEQLERALADARYELAYYLENGAETKAREVREEIEGTSAADPGTKDRLEEAREERERTERRRDEARRELRELERRLVEELGRYETLKAAYEEFKDCVRGVLEQYGATSPDDLPARYRNCDWFDLNRPTRERLRGFDRPRTGGERTGRPGTGPDGLPPLERPAAPPPTGGQPISRQPAAPTGDGLATGGLYEVTRTVEPIDIVLTPVERPRPEDPVTDPGGETGVRTGPETGGAPPSGGGGPPSGGEGGGEGDDPGGGEGGDGGQPGGGDTDGEPAGDDGTIPLNEGGADEILNSPVLTGAPRAPGVQVMIVMSVDVEVPPAATARAGALGSPVAAVRRPSRAGRRAAAPVASGPHAALLRPATDPTVLRPGGGPPAGTDAARTGGAPELEAYLTSLGTSTGDAFRLQVLNRGDRKSVV